jgi:hypothetical protein
MSGIERVVAAILLTGAVVGAAAFAHLLGRNPDLGQIGLPKPGGPGVVQAAPVPAGPLVLSPVRTALLPRAAASGGQFASLQPAKLVRLAPPTHAAAPRTVAPAPAPSTPSTPTPAAPAAPAAPVAPATPAAPAAPVPAAPAPAPAPAPSAPPPTATPRPLPVPPTPAPNPGPVTTPPISHPSLPVPPVAAPVPVPVTAPPLLTSGPVLPKPGPTLPVDGAPDTSAAPSTQDSAQDGGNG